MTGSLRHIMQLAFLSPLLPVLLVFGSLFIGMKFESTLLMDSGREGLPAEMISLKSSSKVVQQDDRVGQLWIKESEEAMKKRCTVNHLRNGFWITARHCVQGLNGQSASGFIRQYDGQSAKVEDVYTKGETEDVALIKVSDGINADSFELPTKSLTFNDEASLIGYGGYHDFPSTAEVRVVAYYDKYSFEAGSFSNILQSVATTDAWSCSGDSGGAIYSGNTIYAVHTAGGANPTCQDRRGGKMWHSDIFPYADWINSLMKETQDSSEGYR